jgi:hypothetical protein
MKAGAAEGLAMGAGLAGVAEFDDGRCGPIAQI